MIISYYKRRGEDIKVLIIVAEDEAELLMKNLKGHYFRHLREDEVTYHQSLKEWDLCIPLGYDGQGCQWYISS